MLTRLLGSDRSDPFRHVVIRVAPQTIAYDGVIPYLALQSGVQPGARCEKGSPFLRAALKTTNRQSEVYRAVDVELYCCTIYPCEPCL